MQTQAQAGHSYKMRFSWGQREAPWILGKSPNSALVRKSSNKRRDLHTNAQILSNRCVVDVHDWLCARMTWYWCTHFSCVCLNWHVCVRMWWVNYVQYKWMICCQGLLDVGRPEATCGGGGGGWGGVKFLLNSVCFILPINQCVCMCVCASICYILSTNIPILPA